MPLVQGRYDSESHAKLALRRWRGLYGDPERDQEGKYFRVRCMPQGDVEHPYAVLMFDNREEADAVSSDGEVRGESA